MTRYSQRNMPSVDQDAFKKAWPRCFVIFISIVMLPAALVLIATELGNVGANFWTTNVFAGGWCGLIMMIEFLAVAVSGGFLNEQENSIC